jgi:hypothetical protein
VDEECCLEEKEEGRGKKEEEGRKRKEEKGEKEEGSVTKI